jgi:hypothetical protein
MIFELLMHHWAQWSLFQILTVELLVAFAVGLFLQNRQQEQLQKVLDEAAKKPSPRRTEP